MWETIALIISAILAGFAICMNFYNINRSDKLDEIEEEQSKMSAHLDEWANELSKWEAELLGWSASWITLKSSYMVTDSDDIKFDTEEDVRRSARDKMAHNIAYDLIRKFNPKEDVVRGKKVYSYTFKIKEGE